MSPNTGGNPQWLKDHLKCNSKERDTAIARTAARLEWEDGLETPPSATTASASNAASNVQSVEAAPSQPVAGSGTPRSQVFDLMDAMFEEPAHIVLNKLQPLATQIEQERDMAHAQVRTLETELAQAKAELVFHKHRVEAAHNSGVVRMPQGDCQCPTCAPIYKQLAEADGLRGRLRKVWDRCERGVNRSLTVEEVLLSKSFLTIIGEKRP